MIARAEHRVVRLKPSSAAQPEPGLRLLQSA